MQFDIGKPKGVYWFWNFGKYIKGIYIKDYNEFNKHQKITSDFDKLLLETKKLDEKKWDYYNHKDGQTFIYEEK